MISLGRKSLLAAFMALAMSQSAAFAPSSFAQRSTVSIKSSIFPIPTTGNLKDVQSELGEDDLYVQNLNEVPRLGTVMKMLPKETWNIDTPTSLFYFGVDFAAVAATMGFLNTVVTSDEYHSFPIWLQGLSVAPLQVLTGFAMWCMWCIGHDAGHSTISKDKNINRVVGEIAHSVMCLTPFVPWATSHRKHHLGHNHLERDYSHQWYIREEIEDIVQPVKFFYEIRMLQLPILYFVYLFLGIPDGGHVIFYGRMWEGVSMKKKLDSAVSVAISVATAGAFWYNMGTADFAVVCMAPWCVMSFWLFMVTYLQHHSEDGKVYTDDTFTFERGAFETVDRNYGKWMNRLSHHMMDGHVIHHLFFERVPHYRLADATKALVEGLDKSGQSHLYKQIDTPNYTQEIIKQFNENWFFVDEKQVVRKL
jgi:omega-3 fatty acid desaturase (delta-15 desaturase)